jgi:hypothetical protein
MSREQGPPAGLRGLKLRVEERVVRTGVWVEGGMVAVRSRRAVAVRAVDVGLTLMKQTKTKTSQHRTRPARPRQRYVSGAMFPHVAVITAMSQLNDAIDEQERWSREHAGEMPDGAEGELLIARREMRKELLEQARKLGEGEEAQEGEWVDHEESRKSETELVVLGLQATRSEYEVAALFGGGSKVRKVVMAGTEVFVAFHKANDATLALDTAADTILRTTNEQTVVKRARYRHKLHKHEAYPDGPQPEYEPYPPLTPTKLGSWTRWGNAEDVEEEGSTWTDWGERGEKGENQWVSYQSSRRSNRTNTRTGATSSRSSTEEMSGWANPEEERSKKRSRGQ